VATNVTVSDLQHGIRDLDLAGALLCIHVSLRSFGWVEGGPASLVDGLLAEGCTVMVPTFANEDYAIPPPFDDRPARNAIDYAEKDATGRDWPGVKRIYSSAAREVDSWMERTPAYVASLPDRIRGDDPGGSFSALGPQADELIVHDDRDSFGPLRALSDANGWVVLMGVDLDRLTLLHLAEVDAGRRSFIRWANGPDGKPQRSRGGECSMGFPNLNPTLGSLERTTKVGRSSWRAFPAAETRLVAAAAIRAEPTITRCARESCFECDDAIAGGPIE
jgi:aminoglycoside 3-N-acetyltransferase